MSSSAFNYNTREFSSQNAVLLGEMANLAYEAPQQVSAHAAERGLQLIEGYDVRDTQAYMLGNSDYLVLAFRGTEMHIRDWMTDINIDLIHGPGGRVHEGFNTALNYVWKDIWTYLYHHRAGRPLWITGHSLGAALATLATAKLRLEKDEPVNGLYTFGQPRTGDREFAKRFDADFGAQTFRYVNNNDIVTRVPFRSLNYSHVGTFRYFDEKGRLRTDISWWDKVTERLRGHMHDLLKPGTDGMKDHGMVHYLGNLKKALD